MAGQHFRAGVVAVVERDDGFVLAFQRTDAPGQWQLPQGGLKREEDPETGVWRELHEETGLGPDDVELVDQLQQWLAYEWPADLYRRVNGDLRRGQVQRWFFFRPRGDDLTPTPDGDEFDDWAWVEPAWLIDQVWTMRRSVYEQAFASRRTDVDD